MKLSLVKFPAYLQSGRERATIETNKHRATSSLTLDLALFTIRGGLTKMLVQKGRCCERTGGLITWIRRSFGYKSSLGLVANQTSSKKKSSVRHPIGLFMPASSRRHQFEPPCHFGNCTAADCKAPASPRRSAPGSPRRSQMLDPLEPKPSGGGQQQWPGVGGDVEDAKGVAAEFEAQAGARGAAGPAESKRSSGHGGGDDHDGESDEKVCVAGHSVTAVTVYGPDYISTRT